MANKAVTLYNFYKQFLHPYEENSVPQSAQLPYLTYNIVTNAWDSGDTGLSISLWYKDTSWASANAMSDKISETIGYGGITLPCDGGYIWLKRGYPFSQNLPDEDSTIKRKLINITAEYLTLN